jgi:hypothetical protein
LFGVGEVDPTGRSRGLQRNRQPDRSTDIQECCNQKIDLSIGAARLRF